MTDQRLGTLRILLLAALALVGAGCATVPTGLPGPTPPPKPENLSVLRSISIGHVLEDQILALDPEHISAAGVATLAAGPTPHLILLHGGIYPVHRAME